MWILNKAASQIKEYVIEMSSKGELIKENKHFKLYRTDGCYFATHILENDQTYEMYPFGSSESSKAVKA